VTAACKALNSQYGSDIINKPLSQLLGSSHPDKYELVQSAAKQLRLSTVTTSISGMDFMPITNKLEEIYLISKDASSTVEHVLSEIVDIATRFAGNGKVQEDMSREFKAAKSTLDKAIDKLCSGSTKSMRDVQDEDKFTRDTADVPTDARFYYAYQHSSGAAVWKNKDDSMGSIPLSYDVFSNIGIDINITVAQMNAFSEALNRADISDKIDDLLRQADKRDSSAEKTEAKIARSLSVLNDTDPDIARNIRALLLTLISYVKAVNVLTDMITSQIAYVTDFCTRSLKIVQSAYAITK